MSTEIKSIVETKLTGTGINYAYRFYNSSVPPIPFITWYISSEELVTSDNLMNTFVDTAEIVIELHSNTKDSASEKKIEKAFCGYNLSKSEDFDYSELIYEVTYRFSLTAKVKRN